MCLIWSRRPIHSCTLLLPFTKEFPCLSWNSRIGSALTRASMWILPTGSLMRVVVTLPGECRLIFWVEESRPSSSSSGQLPLSRTASWVTTCRAQQHGLAAAGGGPGWSSRSLAWKSSKDRNPAGGRRVSPTLTALTILVFLRLHAVTGIAQKCILPQHKEHHEFNMTIEPQNFVVRFPVKGMMDHRSD